jgi:hypothetical protein
MELIKETDFLRLSLETRIDPKKELQKPPVALSIGEYDYRGRMYPIPFGSYGDFSCLVGASKSYKTFLKTALIAGYIGGKSNNYFESIKGHETAEKYILDIDTEQSEFHAHRASRRVMEMVGSDYEFYKPYSLRRLEPKIRYDFIEWLVYESVYRDKIGLITIDGAADLVNDVNDLKESNRVAQAFMKWTQDTKCHLLTVLHKSHGVNKPTGHLGSAILKKAETVAFLEKNSDGITVTPEYTRNYAFEEFRFCIENHLPHQINRGAFR